MSDEGMDAWRADARRRDCYCASMRKPCSYHEGYDDGWHAALAALGEQDTTVTTMYGTENPVRAPKHLTYLDEQDTTPPDDDYRMWQRAAEAPTVYSAPLPAPDRCPTCGSDDPTRQQGLPHTDLHAQVRCRDRWHAVLSVEGNP